MTKDFLACVAALGLLCVMVESQERAFAQAAHEPTIDERFRDDNVKPAQAELPQLLPPQNSPSLLTHAKTAPVRNAPAAYLGVTFGDGLPAIVRTVAPGSPAEQAGLRQDDLIVTLQGRRIRTNDDVIDVVSQMRPGDILDIGFSRRMSIRTQAPLAEMPSATTRSVGYPPESEMLPLNNEAAPEAPQKLAPKAAQPNRNATPQNRSNSANTQRRNDNSKSSSKSNSNDDNRRLLGRGLRNR